jgi:hypothetical protein
MALAGIRKRNTQIFSVDVIPAYDEQPGPSADNYIRDPDYPVEAYFIKNLKRVDKLLL